MQAESRDIDNRRTLAWWVDTDQGRLRTWAPTADEARGKVEARGLRVLDVRPAGSLLDNSQEANP